MIVARRLWPAAVLILGLAISAASPARAADLSGNWDALVVAQCNAATVGAAFCAPLEPSTVARSVTAWHATCGATGGCTFTEAIANLGSNVGSSPCAGVLTVAFSGTCTFVWKGSAQILPTKIGVPTFQIASESATIYPSPLMGAPSFTIQGTATAASPYDTAIPAVPGTYLNTTQNLQVEGLLPAGVIAPPGLTVIAAISHTPAGSPPAVLSLPLPASSTPFGATSGGFVVSWYGPNAGMGVVNFGTSCGGLVGTSFSDMVPGGNLHLVVVTGNEMPGWGGDVGVMAGTTYSFQAATTSSSGTATYNNGGSCYSVSLPTSS
jgi:hypothetical protein